jgi:hypothetical protein
MRPSRPFRVFEAPLGALAEPHVVVPRGLALFGLFLGASGSLGMAQAALLRRRRPSVEGLVLERHPR